ncbi:transmembrane protein, putative, partial [Bodo saltans]
MIVGLVANPNIYTTTFLTVTRSSSGATVSVNKSLVTTSLSPSTPQQNYAQLLRYGVAVADEEDDSTSLTSSLGQEVEATVAFVPSARFLAQYYVGVDTTSAAAVAEATASLLGISVEEYTNTISASIVPLAPWICGAIIAIDPQEDEQFGATTSDVLEPRAIDEAPVKGQKFVNNIACTSKVQRVVGSNTSLLSYEFSATLSFKNFAVTATNTNQMYFGLAVMGQIVPLTFQASGGGGGGGTKQQFPQKPLFAVEAITNVTAVSASCSGCTVATVTEQQIIGSGTLSVAVRGGLSNRPLSGKTVYLYALLLSRSTASSSSSSEIVEEKEKTLLFETAVTLQDGRGIATFTNVRFSSTGTTGTYKIFAVCDGVKATWSLPSSSSSPRSFLQVTVVSSVSSAEIVAGGSSSSSSVSNHVEIVGETWEALPQVLIVGADGVGIPGKQFTITTTSSVFDAQITSTSLPSDNQGLAVLSSAVIHSLNVSSWSQLNSPSVDGVPQLVEFRILVDGNAFGSFTRVIAPPRNFSWLVSPTASVHHKLEKKSFKSLASGRDDAATIVAGDHDATEWVGLSNQGKKMAHSRFETSTPKAESEHASHKAAAPSTTVQLLVAQVAVVNDGYTPAHRTSRTLSASQQHGACAFVRITNQPHQLRDGSFAVPVYLYGQALDALGNAVGANVSVALAASLLTARSSSSSSSPQGSLISSHVMMTEQDGRFALQMTVTPRAGAMTLNILVSVACGEEIANAVSNNVLLLTFSSRVSGATNASVYLSNDAVNSSTTVCMQLTIRNASLVTDLAPVTVTLVPRWLPQYVVSYLTPDQLRVIPSVMITNATTDPETHQICITIPSNMNSSSLPPGTYGFLLSCDGSLMAPFTVITTRVTTSAARRLALRVNQSMFSSSLDTSLSVGAAVPRQPIIQAYYLDNVAAGVETPAENVTVFLQLAHVSTSSSGSTTRTYQDVYQSPRDLFMGAIAMNVTATSNNNTTPQLRKPIGSKTDDNGFSYFNDLVLLGSPVGVRFSARYCVMINAFDDDDNGTGKICVDDPNTAMLPLTQATTVVANVSSMSGSPGQSIAAISLTLTLPLLLTTQPTAVACTPTFVNTADNIYLKFYSDLSSFAANSTVGGGADQLLSATLFNAAVGTFYSTGNVLMIPEGSVALSPLTPVGTYFLQFVCLGSATITPIPLVVSSIPASIHIVTPPPTDPVSLNTTVVVAARLLSPSSSPVVFRDVELAIQSFTPAANCSGKPCGYLDAASKLYATTDVNGDAVFSFSFTAGKNASQFALRFQVASGDLSVSASTSHLQALSNLFGIPSANLVKNFLLQHPDELTNMFNLVVSAAVQRNSQDAGGIALSGGASTISIESSQKGDDDGSSSSFTSYVNPLASLVGLLSSSNALLSADNDEEGATATATLTLLNRVTDGVMLRPPTFPDVIELPPPQDVVPSDVLESSGVDLSSTELAVKASVTLSGELAPILQFFYASGAPAVNHTITLEVLPVNDNDCVVTAPSTSLVTDVNGTVVLASMIITAFTPGTYQLQFSVDGGGAITTNTFVVTQRPSLGRKQVMQYVAVAVICFFSPMLLASVPHSRPAYLVVGCIVAIAAAAAAWSLVHDLVPEDTNQPLYQGYYYFLNVLTSSVAAATVVMTISEVLSVKSVRWSREKRVQQERGWYALRTYNDEKRAEDVFRYATWITNVRIKQQAQEWEQHELEEINALGARFGRYLDGISIKWTRTLNRLLLGKKGAKERDDELKQAEWDLAQSMIPATQTKLLYAPSEAFDAVYPPINFLIVVGISTVLLVTLLFILSFIYSYVYRKINLLMSYLPNTTGSDGAQLAIANKALILSITAVVNSIVQVFPNLAALASLNNAISDVDILQILGDVRGFFEGGLIRFEVTFWVAGTVASVCFVVTLVLTWATIPNTIRQIRRGNLHIASKINPIEAYIGMHCLQLVIMHQLVFWILAVIVFLLSVDAVRVWIWDELSAIVIASLSVYLTQTLMIELVVSKYLSDGKWLIIRPELYSIWHFIGLILGVFSGIMKSVVRVAMALGFVCLLFARVDQAIYPALFASMDKGHTGFLSSVNIEAKTGNPIFLMFCTLLLFEKRLRDVGEEETLVGEHQDKKNGVTEKIDSTGKNDCTN